MSNNSSSSGGISAISLLGVAFVVLKLCHVIDWSWWWVTAPFWGAFALLAVGAVVYIVIQIFAAWYKSVRKQQRNAWEAAKVIEEHEKPKLSKSKFLEKLEEAQKLSEERRNKKS